MIGIIIAILSCVCMFFSGYIFGFKRGFKQGIYTGYYAYEEHIKKISVDLCSLDSEFNKREQEYMDYVREYLNKHQAKLQESEKER